MSKSEEFLRTSSSGHLAVVLIRGDCVSKLQINFVKLSYSAKKTCNFETFFANFFQRLQVQSMTEVKNIKNNFVKLSYSAKKTCNFETFCANFFQRQGKICKQIKISSTVLLSILLNELPSDVGLRRTCAYYRTFARAMCVRKGFRNCACDVRACCSFRACDVRSHFCTIFWTKWQDFLFQNILFLI